jgi:CHAT domain-containing protein
MKNIPKFLVIAILFLFGSGCATTAQKLNSAELKGDFVSMEKYAKQLTPDLSKAEARDIFPLCFSYSKTKKYSKLLQCLDSLDEAIKREGDIDKSGVIVRDFYYPLTPKSHLLRAETLLDLGEYPRALEYAKMAYESGPKSIEIGRYGTFPIYSLSTLSVAYTVNNDRNNAVRYIDMLKELDIGFRHRHAQPVKYTELAKTYLALKGYKEALNMIEQEKSGLINVVNIALEIGGGLFGYGLGNLLLVPITGWGSFDSFQKDFIYSKCQFETGQIENAKEGYDKLIENSIISGYGDIHWSVLSDRGLIAERDGNNKEAIEYYRKAINIIEQQRSTINTEISKIGFVGNKQKVYHQMISTLYSYGQYANAFEYVERSKSRALVDLLASNKEIDTSKDKEQVASMLKEIETIETEGKALDVSSLATDKINERNTRSVQIKEKIKAIAPELSSLIAVSIPHSSEIQSYINNDETLLEYYYHGEDIYAFVVKKNVLKAVKLDGQNLVNVIGQFRKLLEDPKSQQYLELSQKLYQRLIKPIEYLINAQKLIIVPHGVLHYLPFNALNSGNSYLIDKYSVSYLPSSSIMKFLKQRKTQAAKNALIFGNPDLGDPKYDLKYAEEEAVTISKGFPSAKVLIRKEATKTAFKKIGSQFDYIHFATHGQFESDAPLNSGLFLAKDSENDGVLSVNELYSIRLNADLITLSACETALGKINPGDDVVGLTRGFLFAGSSSIVASLWKVDDMATAQLMTEFYSNLRKTNKRDALRDAQLNIKKQYEHPYFWAAFQLTGIAD